MYNMFIPFLLAASFITTALTIDDVCLWGRDNGDDALNGEYVYSGNYSGNPYYLYQTNSCSLPTLYMYIRESQWYIGATLGGSAAYAKCDITKVYYPADCGLHWYFGTDGSADDEASVTAAPCPSLPCEQLELALSPGNGTAANECIGVYDTEVADNVYQRAVGDEYRYLFFNDRSFKWVCAQNYTTTNKCYVYYGKAHSSEWYDLSNTESATFEWSDSDTATLTCTGGTPAPTSPTMAPNTPVPTTEATTDDVCMWYRGEERDDTSDMFLNGLYRYNGTYDGKNYYVTKSDSCKLGLGYLYYRSDKSKWYIDGELGGDTYYAECQYENLQTPLDCGTNWLFGSESSVDEDAELLVATCPSIDCPNGIELETLENDKTGTCFGEFSDFVYESDDDDASSLISNVYLKSDNNYYLYFNEKDFRWVCSPTLNISACYEYHARQYVRSWFDIDINTPSPDFEFHTKDNDYNVTIQCIGTTDSPQTEPTSTPVPILYHPTKSPNSDDGGDGSSTSHASDGESLEWWVYLVIVGAILLVLVIVGVIVHGRYKKKVDSERVELGYQTLDG